MGLTQYGGPNHGQPVPGAPGFICPSVTGWGVGQTGVIRWSIPPFTTPPTGYKYGQARVMNISGARIRIIEYPYTRVTHWQ